MDERYTVVVADGTRHWRAIALRGLREKPNAALFVAVFTAPSGRIGFDLADEGEEIFASIVGTGDSWDPKQGEPATHGSGLTTHYVRSLFISGLTTPITLSVTPLGEKLGGSHPALADLREIDRLSRIDVDEESGGFAQGVANLAKRVDRVCVHSVSEWETSIVTSHGPNLLERLRAVCESSGVGFRHVHSEDSLPRW